jgi:hypothetical protein
MISVPLTDTINVLPTDTTNAFCSSEWHYCKALFWYGERIENLRGKQTIIYNNYCKGGKVYIPPYRSWPDPLSTLARFDGNATMMKFMQNIRQYNCMFAFTSMGAHIDNSVNDGRAPPLFKISSQVYHHIGSLLPPDDGPPKFIQLYIYDTSKGVTSRLRCLNPEETSSGCLEASIGYGLMKMLDHYNPFVKKFRIARERL